MKALRNFAVALLTGVAGATISLPVADWLSNIYRISNFEGQRGYMVIFLFVPLGIVVGLICGFIAATRIKHPDWRGFAQALGTGLAMLLIVAATTSVLYALADKPPRIDGKRLVLESEARIPPAIQLPAEINQYSMSGSLYVDSGENRVAEIDPNSIATRGGYSFLTGKVELVVHGHRSLLLSVGNVTGGSQFIKLPLSSSPRKEDERWSDWTLAPERSDLTPVPPAEQFALRYRVQEVSE
ncbi:MAG: hypothetical protein QOH24_740 [Verrucomicrobiota bacterium]|jgi:MFS family permease